jgi:hypothetical protein
MSTAPLGSGRAAAFGLAGAGLLMALGGGLHPRVEGGATYEDGLAGMFESSAWAASHGLAMAGYVALAASLLLLVRAVGVSWASRMRVIASTAAAAAGLAATETVPHMLASADAAELRAGADASLAELHSILQAFTSPALGLSVAALAVVGARSGALDGGRIATALAVVGGLAFAVAGPALAITHDTALSPLFAGSAGIAVWAIVTGARLVRAQRSIGPAAEAVR